MRLRPIASSLTYANVVATIALFLALGGASYAVATLPADSVGPRQLRARAVTPASLAFPIGATYVVDRARQDIPKGRCNALPLPGMPAPPCVLPAIERRVRTPGREAHFKLTFRGRVLVTAIVGLDDQGPKGTTAEASLAVILDGRIVEQSRLRLLGGEAQRVPLQVPIELDSGSHRVGLTADAHYDYTFDTPGDVIVGPVTITVAALPSLQH